MVLACISSHKVTELVALSPPCLMDLASPQQSSYLKQGPVVTEAKALLVLATLATKLGADVQCIPTSVQFLSFGQQV